MNQMDLTQTMTTEERAYQRIIQATSLEDMTTRLVEYPCKRCTLSKLQNRVVVFRGSLDAKIMLVGEAPGKVEDRTRSPFTGPAGELTDKIFAAVGISTNRDMYLGNICKCRPVAQKGSGRENFTPQADQRKQCMPYILREIELLNPKLIIACGLTAAKTLFNMGENTRMKHIASKNFTKDEPSQLKGRTLFVMYHPAAILHAQGDRKRELREIMWKDAQELRRVVDGLGITLIGCLPEGADRECQTGVKTA